MTNHDEEAALRDAEVARLHPGAPRWHVRATLPARVVLRAVEKRDGDDEVPLVGKTPLTVTMDGGRVEFYDGASPVRHAGSIDVGDVVAVGTGHELNALPPTVESVLRLSVADVGTKPLDVDLEVFTFDGASLRPSQDVAAEAAAWSAALGR